MSLFVVETDAPCKNCAASHGYVTSMCSLAVFVDRGTARWIARAIEGSAVREIRDVPEGVSYTLYLQKNGRPDARYPRTQTVLPRG